MKNKKDAHGKEYDISLHWCVTNTCNFSCPQCAGNARKMEGDYVPEKINIEVLKKFLAGLNKTAQFVFTGGEPLFVENIIDAFVELTKEHYIVLITNLVSSKVKEMAERVNHERVSYIKASAHILELEKHNLLDKFFSNYRLLKEKGHTVHVAEVAYPFMIDKIDYYKKMFKENGIDLEFQAFRGSWKDKKYPDAYSEDETRLFGFEKETVYRPDIFKHKGDLCIAGYNVAIINPVGEIYPCYSIMEKIGHIETGVSFRGTMTRCPYDYCDCPLQVLEPYLSEKALEEIGSINKI